MKEIILSKLRDYKSGYVSGEMLSEALGVSRTAVWKCIRELKEEGYIIDSSPRKGYRLIDAPDILNQSEIAHGLNTATFGKEIHCFKTIGSTNTYAKKIAYEGCSDGTLIVAESQTEGRGRLGRQWDSADKKGVWMSIVTRPLISPDSVQIITLAASVAVVEAIFTTTGIRTGIKWPNDIILEGKKVCGILTEMSCEMERVNFLVIGIGINVKQTQEDFPEEIANTAMSLNIYNEYHGFTIKLRRAEIIKAVLEELEKQYDRIKCGETDKIIDDWKKYSVTLGKQVKINKNGSEYIGVASGITRDGKLVLKSADGNEYEVLSGEVSVRGMLGYV